MKDKKFRKLEEETIKEMEELVGGDDPECDHIAADDIVERFLYKIGSRKLSKLYGKVHKWYG